MQQPAVAAPLPQDRGWKMGSSSGVSEALAPGPQSLAPDIESLQQTEAIRALMWRGAGLFRTRDGLTDAVQQLDRCYRESRDAMNRTTSTAAEWKRFNLLTVARLIARAALRREESRGGHYREDFPARDDLHWRVHLVDKIDG